MMLIVPAIMRRIAAKIALPSPLIGVSFRRTCAERDPSPGRPRRQPPERVPAGALYLRQQVGLRRSELLVGQAPALVQRRQPLEALEPLILGLGRGGLSTARCQLPQALAHAVARPAGAEAPAL